VATADATCRCPRAMHIRDNSCHANVARATDHNQGIEGTYLPRTGQCGRAVSCKPAEPCACHSGTGESKMFYAHCTLLNLTTCIHSPYSYILCVSEAKMAARWPPTPSPRVTATGVDIVQVRSDVHRQELVSTLEWGTDGHTSKYTPLDRNRPARIPCLRPFQ
jgi:hypothetical protein